MSSRTCPWFPTPIAQWVVRENNSPSKCRPDRASLSGTVSGRSNIWIHLSIKTSSRIRYPQRKVHRLAHTVLTLNLTDLWKRLLYEPSDHSVGWHSHSFGLRYTKEFRESEHVCLRLLGAWTMLIIHPELMSEDNSKISPTTPLALHMVRPS
jgi:hypothetical protein